jgi:transposase InsO family protein
MPWEHLSVMDQREEFVRLALMPGANISELCRRYKISRDKGYKWLRRYQAEGRAGLGDRSRRPHVSPDRTAAGVEAEVLAIRAESNEAWGGRKIEAAMRRRGRVVIPSPSTITEILRRNGRLEAGGGQQRGPWQRFERPWPNDLWQMDFKGHFGLRQGRCYPLTILDDHSRFALTVSACGDEQGQTVQRQLVSVFERCGLPWAMLMDNGPPWGGEQPYNVVTVWLMRLGVHVSHGRPYHPQTQGKDERFHRTLKAEVLNNRSFADLEQCQGAFDVFRHRYNNERPHQAIDMKVPAERYRPSARCFPRQLPDVEYGPDDLVRKVDADGFISFKSRPWRISKAFRAQHVALRPTLEDGVFTVHFCTQQIADIDLRQATPPACGFVDIATAMPTTPQAQQQPQPTLEQ